jgi:hypothetical protein
LIRVRSGRSSSGVCQQETNGDDQIAISLEESIDVALIVGLLLRLEVLNLDTKITLSFQQTIPGCLVEGAVIDTTGIGYLAD